MTQLARAPAISRDSTDVWKDEQTKTRSSCSRALLNFTLTGERDSSESKSVDSFDHSFSADMSFRFFLHLTPQAESFLFKVIDSAHHPCPEYHLARSKAVTTTSYNCGQSKIASIASGCKMVTLGLDDEADRNRYDIMESFEALDTQKTGCLDFDVAYTLLLGLGYMSDYKKKDDFGVTTLKEAAKRIESVQNENYDGAQYGSGIDLETLLAVVDTVRQFFLDLV